MSPFAALLIAAAVIFALRIAYRMGKVAGAIETAGEIGEVMRTEFELHGKPPRDFLTDQRMAGREGRQ